MVSGNYINLIKEFTVEQRNNDYIVLTSFCFDPYFFDKYLYHKIRANNPEAEILVLIDGGQYAQSLERFTNETGCKYLLIPIYVQNGVFHPKVSLFVSKSDKIATVYVSSSNLTLPGFTRNAEISAKIRYDQNYVDKNVDKINEFFISLIKKKYIRDEKSIAVITQALESFPAIQEPREEMDYEFIHNLDTSIISAMMKSVAPTFDYEAILLAPFFAPDEAVIKEIIKYIKIHKIFVALPRNRNNLSDPIPYIDFFNSHNIGWEFCEAEFSLDASRVFHSKLIYLKSQMNYLLIGSPNITNAALLKNGDNGNIECAILLKGTNAESFIRNINLTDIEVWNESSDLEIDQEINSSFNNLKIFSAKFNDIERSLELIIEPIDSEFSVCIMMDDESELIYKNIPNLAGGELQIKIQTGIPKEVKISSKEKSARFRIYYDKGYFLRNIPKNKESLRQIHARLSNDFTQDQSEIYAMIIGLARQNQELKGTMNSTQDKIANNKEGNFNLQIKPSKIRSSGSNLSYIDRLNKLYLSLSYAKRQMQSYENLDSDEIEQGSSEEPDFLKFSVIQPELSKSIYKHIDLIDRIVIENAYLLEKVDQKDNLVQSQSNFIDFILRYFNIDLKENHFEHIVEKLENNLNMVCREEISKGSSINLFMRIIAINYCYDMRIHPQFMSSLFLFSDLADEKTYYSIKEFVIMYQKNYCTNKTTFMLNHFQLHYSSLMTFVFSPSNISHGSVELVKSIIDTKDQEFFDFIGLILIKLKYGAWEQKKGGGRISLFTPRKKIKEMNYDFSILDCRKLRYIDEFLNESLQRERI